MSRFPTDDLNFGGPAIYRIVVQGSLSQRMSCHFEEMEIATVRRPGHPDQTTLTGPVRDQAALAGVLDTLYGMHLPIASVKVVADGDPPESEKNCKQD